MTKQQKSGIRKSGLGGLIKNLLCRMFLLVVKNVIPWGTRTGEDIIWGLSQEERVGAWWPLPA